ncbi:MAG: hypothetical protein KA354_18285 [Phycisphaerae bacterium]|nr:hypothetical protein [Phycisphaerae bacterium]
MTRNPPAEATPRLDDFRRGDDGASCRRGDLAKWSAEGGPLPARLSRHIELCPACRAQVSRVNRVQASLTLLQGQALPPNLHARANGRALRLLRRAERASAAARDLLHRRPDLPYWQRIQFQITRLSCGVAAALLLLVIRVGVVHAAEETREWGETLAAMYADRHINPDGHDAGGDSRLA